MISHNIKIAKEDEAVVLYNTSRWDHNKCKNQKDLDEFLATHAWMQPGVLCCYKGVLSKESRVLNYYTLNFIISVCTDFNKLKTISFEDGYPRCFLIANTQFDTLSQQRSLYDRKYQELPMGTQIPGYLRWTSGIDLVIIEKEKVKDILSDYVQNNIEQFSTIAREKFTTPCYPWH